MLPYTSHGVTVFHLYNKDGSALSSNSPSGSNTLVQSIVFSRLSHQIIAHKCIRTAGRHVYDRHTLLQEEKLETYSDDGLREKLKDLSLLQRPGPQTMALSYAGGGYVTCGVQGSGSTASGC